VVGSRTGRAALRSPRRPELKSTVEELETTNEELQSTNEELETMNEELQSTNEELQTINGELRQRSDDLNYTNAFLQSVITGVRSGVVVVDRELYVIAWNHRAEDLWGLRADEVRGQNFLNLDIGLLRSCLAGEQEHSEVVVKATNRRGRAITCRVTSTPLLGSSQEVRGAILMIDEQPTSH
jgi:two-component system CheB/CheR fusion protein